MLRYLAYPVFGLVVLGGYAASASRAVDLSSPDVRRGRVTMGPGVDVVAAPIPWAVGFRGPAVYVPPSTGTTRGYGSYGGGYGGYGGGK